MPTLQVLLEQRFDVDLAYESAYVPLSQDHPEIDAVVDAAQPWSEASGLHDDSPEWFAAQLQSEPDGLLLPERRTELRVPSNLQAWAQASCPERFAVLEVPREQSEAMAYSGGLRTAAAPSVCRASRDGNMGKPRKEPSIGPAA